MCIGIGEVSSVGVADDDEHEVSGFSSSASSEVGASCGDV